MKKMLFPICLILTYFIIYLDAYSVPTAQLISPINNAQITNHPITFSWSVDGQSNYFYMLTVKKGNEIAIQEYSMTTSITIDNIPGNSDSYSWYVSVYDTTNPFGTTTSQSFYFSYQLENPNEDMVLLSPINGAENITAQNAKFTWQPYPEAVSYTIAVSSSEYFMIYDIYRSIDSTSYVANINELKPNTTYYWKVSAALLDTGVVSIASWSDVWSFTTNASQAPNYVPILISPENGASDVSINNIELKWGSVDSALSYYIEMAEDSTFENPFIEEQLYSDSYLCPLTIPYNFKCYWRVRTQYLSGGQYLYSDWSQTSYFTTTNDPNHNYKVNLISPVNGAENVQLSHYFEWSEVPGTVGYEVTFMREGSPDLLFTGMEHTFLGLIANSNYNWKVRAAYMNQDSTYAYTAWSETWSFQTADNSVQMMPPEIIYPQNATTIDYDPASNLVLLWGNVANANSFQLQASFTQDFSQNILDTITQYTSYEYYNVPYNTSIYWRVRGLITNNDGIIAAGTWTAPTMFIILREVCTVQLISPRNSENNLPIDVTFLWAPINNYPNYQFQLCADSIFNPSSVTLNELIESNTFTFSNLSSNSNYSWRVRAYNTIDTLDWSNPWSFSTGNSTIGINPTEPPDGERIDTSDITVIWSEVENASSYRFQLSESVQFGKILIKHDEQLLDGTHNIILDTLVTDNKINLKLFGTNKSYFWRTYAKLSENDSTCWTPTWSFIINSPASVQSDNQLIKATLYPTIATSQINLSIEFSELQDIKIGIYAVNGLLIKVSEFINNSNICIPVDDLSNGMYYLKLEASGIVDYLPFIIVR